MIVVIQVRMASTRLPGKALADVLGRPILGHIVDRVHVARRVEGVIIATSGDLSDAPIRDFAANEKIACYAGSEIDLIQRLFRAGTQMQAHALVRVTGDCPLVDPNQIDRLIEVYQSDPSAVDCVCNTHPPTFPDGLDLEVYPMSLLARLNDEIRDPFWREWFPSYITGHPEFKIVNVLNETDTSGMRWTLDYPEDLVFIREIYHRLHRQGSVFVMKDIMSLLKGNPELSSINARYARNEGFIMALSNQAENPGG